MVGGIWQADERKSRNRFLAVALFVCFLAFFFSSLAAQTQPISQPSSPPPSTEQGQPPPDLQKLQLELSKLQLETLTQKEAFNILKNYAEIGAILFTILGSIVAGVSVVAIILQILGFRVDARNRVKDEELGRRFTSLLDLATTSARDAQEKVKNLEAGGIKKANDTLQLINNLLQITERAAAKAAYAQFDFWSKSIETFDAECRNLITEADEKDERDIIAKPKFVERVKVLTEGIKALDSQITSYNESTLTQFGRPDSGPDDGSTRNSQRLALTAPCLLIRGLSHHIQQNFRAAIGDWEAALRAKGASAVIVDANYWIGYLSNTLGNFERASSHLDAAANVAPTRRKAELKRLEIETRFFALDYAQVPETLLREGDQSFEQMAPLMTPRAASSFATTMGNISLIAHIRTGLNSEFEFPDRANHWFEKALTAEKKSRWARFAICQNLVVASRSLDAEAKQAVRDVVRSVGNEYQNRQEHRSKALSRITEYICMLMLNEHEELSTIAASVLYHTSEVTARTLYSQFRKQNVDKAVFLREFEHLRGTKNLRDTFRMANTKIEDERPQDVSGSSERF